eukprot:1370616-Rhodomonas_salina.3
MGGWRGGEQSLARREELEAREKEAQVECWVSAAAAAAWHVGPALDSQPESADFTCKLRGRAASRGAVRRADAPAGSFGAELRRHTPDAPPRPAALRPQRVPILEGKSS